MRSKILKFSLTFCALFLFTFNGYSQKKLSANRAINYPNAMILEQDSLAPTSYTEKSLRFYKDKNSVFNDRMEIIADVDSKSFSIISDYLIKDKNHIYWKDYPNGFIKNQDIDVVSFQFFDEKEDYHILKDKQEVYVFYNRHFKVLKDANPKTFKKFYKHVYGDDKFLYDYTGAIISKFSNISSTENRLEKSIDEERSLSQISIDQSKLKLINHGIFTDGNYIFSLKWLKVFQNADPLSFKILTEEYAKDKNRVYKFGESVDIYDSETFEVLSSSSGGSFVKDKNGLYWDDHWVKTKLTDADAENLKILPFDYAIFNGNVYHRSSKLVKADPKTFNILKDSNGNPAIAVDKNSIFWENKAVKEFALKTVIEVIGEYEWMDNNNWYKLAYDENLYQYNTKKCSRIKANNLPTEKYYILKEEVYYYGGFCQGKLIETADAASFEMINDKYAKDKNHVYYEGKPIVQFVYLNAEGELDYCTKESFSMAQQLVKDGYTKDDIYKNLNLFFGIKPKREEAENLINIAIDKIEAMSNSEIEEIRIQPSTLHLFEGNHGKDAHFYFRNGSIFLTRSSKTPILDFATFQGVGNSWGYYKDKNNVYDDDLKILDWVDVETLKPIYAPK